MFRVGDKVFAKIRGYPEWPAIITEECNKKYKVLFYGTGEVGDVKKECVHHYLENKHRFVKSSLKKRRPYLAAIEEIEAAIASDYNENENNSKTRKSCEKKSCDAHSASFETSADETIFERTTDFQVGDNTQPNDNDLGRTKSPFHIDNAKMEPNIKIISKKYLHLLIEYAKLVENDVISYKNEPFSVFPENEIVVANAPCGKLIPVAFDRSGSYKNELERALHEAKLAEETLLAVESLEKGLQTPNATIKNDLDLTGTYVDQLKEYQLVEFLKQKLGYLKTEATLAKLGQNVRQHLKLEEAQPKIALKYLDEMLQLKIDGLMLKKQWEVVDLVKKLQKYVGNVKMWDFNSETLENFIKDTKEIQEKAYDLEKKFSDLFSTPANASFWDFFNKELEDFRRKTTNMSEAEILSIHSEPDTRQGFFDRAYENLFMFKNAAKNN